MTVLGEIEPVWILSPQLREKFLEGAKFIGLQRLTETASRTLPIQSRVATPGAGEIGSVHRCPMSPIVQGC
jgi:hypothetical protein